MASSHPHSSWEAPTFHFNSPNQSKDWRIFYTRALDYLDTLDIEPDHADDNQRGWKQLKLMFEGKDRQDLQTLIDNGIIMPEDMKPRATLDATVTTINLEQHFGPTRMNLSLTLGNSLARGYMCCPSAFLTSPLSAGSLTPKPSRCWS